MSEYKAGDVVLHPERGRGIVQQGFAQWIEWATITGFTPLDEVVDDLRRLVVIDPESAEDVERLVGHDAFLGAMAADHDIRVMQVALREYAEPTLEPLAEPTDLSARVLDKDGDEWARSSYSGLWCCLTSPSDPEEWAVIEREYGPLRLAGDER